MFWVKEFRVDVLGGVEIAADDENLSGDITVRMLALSALEVEGCRHTYRDDGGFVASTLPNN